MLGSVCLWEGCVIGEDVCARSDRGVLDYFMANLEGTTRTHQSSNSSSSYLWFLRGFPSGPPPYGFYLCLSRAQASIVSSSNTSAKIIFSISRESLLRVTISCTVFLGNSSCDLLPIFHFKKIRNHIQSICLFIEQIFIELPLCTQCCSRSGR